MMSYNLGVLNYNFGVIASSKWKFLSDDLGYL